jgi:hypothetical protein
MHGGRDARRLVSGCVVLFLAYALAEESGGLSESLRLAARMAAIPLFAVVGVILIVQGYRRRSFTRIDVEQDGSVLMMTEVLLGGAPDVSRVDLAPGRMLITRQEDRFEWVILVQNNVNLPLIKLPREPAARLRFLHAVESLLLPPKPPVPAGEPGS